ncbi:uncharacterized protein LOC144141652 [Haemaphysalis longicornis]
MLCDSVSASVFHLQALKLLLHLKTISWLLFPTKTSKMLPCCSNVERILCCLRPSIGQRIHSWLFLACYRLLAYCTSTWLLRSVMSCDTVSAGVFHLKALKLLLYLKTTSWLLLHLKAISLLLLPTKTVELRPLVQDASLLQKRGTHPMLPVFALWTAGATVSEWAAYVFSLLCSLPSSGKRRHSWLLLARYRALTLLLHLKTVSWMLWPTKTVKLRPLVQDASLHQQRGTRPLLPLPLKWQRTHSWLFLACYRLLAYCTATWHLSC